MGRPPVVGIAAKALVGFQCLFQQLCRQRRGIGIRHDLVVIAMHHRTGTVTSSGLGEVRREKGDDAV